MQVLKATFRKAGVNLALFLASVVLILFLGDAALRLVGSPVEHSLRPTHPPHVDEKRRSVDFEYVFRTNSQGLRYRELPRRDSIRQPAAFRVFVAGDSYVEGWGVEDGERFTDLMERRFEVIGPSTLFINGGIAGTGPLQYGRIFLEVGLDYEPDALLVCLFANDLANTPRGRIDIGQSSVVPRYRVAKLAHRLWPGIYALLERFAADRSRFARTRTDDFVATITDQALRRGIPRARIESWKSALPDEWVDAVNRGELNGSILSYGLLYPSYWSDSIDLSSSVALEKWRNMSIVLSQIVERARVESIEIAVVYLPSQFQYDETSHSVHNPWIRGGVRTRTEWLSEETEIQKRLRAWSREEEIALLDLTPEFRKVARFGGVNWERDGHWNRLGHEIAASALSSWLSEKSIFSFLDQRVPTSASEESTGTPGITDK